MMSKKPEKVVLCTAVCAYSQIVYVFSVVPFFGSDFKHYFTDKSIKSFYIAFKLSLIIQTFLRQFWTSSVMKILKQDVLVTRIAE